MEDMPLPRFEMIVRILSSFGFIGVLEISWKTDRFRKTHKVVTIIKIIHKLTLTFSFQMFSEKVIIKLLIIILHLVHKLTFLIHWPCAVEKANLVSHKQKYNVKLCVGLLYKNLYLTVYVLDTQNWTHKKNSKMCEVITGTGRMSGIRLHYLTSCIVPSTFLIYETFKQPLNCHEDIDQNEELAYYR